jgi:tetratricopeptide (TPR) repeat protein
MAVWALAECLQHYACGRAVAILVTAAVLTFLGTATRIQAGYWKDSVTLFEHTLEVTSDNWVIHNNLAAVLLERNQKQQALSHLLETIRIVPEHDNAYYNLGTFYNGSGDTARAIRAFQRTIELNPSYADAYFHLGINQFVSGDSTAAYETYRSLSRIDPEKARALDGYFEFLKSR